MEGYLKNKVVLSEDETEALLSMIQLIILSKTKYYYTDSKDELSVTDRADVYKDIEQWWKWYDQIICNKFDFGDLELIEKVVLNLDFDIVEAIYVEDYVFDNLVWLYNVLSAWHKLSGYVKEAEERRDNNDSCDECVIPVSLLI